MKMPANTFKSSQKLLVFLLLVLSSCATIGGVNGFDGVSASHPSATEPIAKDAARLMAGFYPPGHTSLHVNPATGFGQAFDVALRQRGFTMSESGIPVKYQLDMLDTGLCYLSLRTPGNVITQSYVLSGGGIVSGSPVTVTDGMSFTEPAEPSYIQSSLPPAPVQQSRLKLVLLTPPNESLKSGITRDVTMAVMENGRAVPGANLRFHHSAGYPNLRAVDRFADSNGRLTLRSLIIQDINLPMLATVNGQEIKLYLNGGTQTEPITAAKPVPAQPVPALPAGTPNPASTLPPQTEFAAVLAEIGGDRQTEPVKSTSKPAPVQTVQPVPALPPQSNKSVSVQSDPTATSPMPNLAPVPTAKGTSFTGPKEKPSYVESDIPPEPVRIEETWKIEHGLLREQLIRWADKAGYQVVWKASSDYDIYTSATFRGSFDIAVEELFTRLHAHGNALRVGIYKANKVIEVNED